MDVKERFAKIAHDWDNLNSQFVQWQNTLVTAQTRMEEILQEQDLITKSLFALDQARPLLSASSIKECESLANAALQSVFESEAKVEWSVEDEQFMLIHPEGFKTPLVSEGGGFLTVISFVFQVYLIIKLKKRRVLIMDEFFTCISDSYLENFFAFLKQLCKDLNFTCILVSHDSRLQEYHVDRMYEIEKGFSKRIK